MSRCIALYAGLRFAGHRERCIAMHAGRNICAGISVLIVRYRRTARADALTCVPITGSITESICERRKDMKKRIGKRHLNKKIRRALEIIADVLGVVAFWALVYILIIVYG